MNKHKIWSISLIIIIIILCGTLIWVNHNSWTIRFEMDNNTLEAVKNVCFINGNKIPCDLFSGDEHFCNDGICEMNGVCPNPPFDNRTLLECIRGVEK